MSEKTFYTRAEYLAASKQTQPGEIPEAFRRYYGQFVTPGTVATVLGAIGGAALRASKDAHFNDIPLHKWDRIAPHLPGSRQFAKAGDYYTLSGGVCLAKEAARQWLESNKE